MADNSFQVRLDRMSQIENEWGFERVRPLIVRKRIPAKIWDLLKFSALSYLGASIGRYGLREEEVYELSSDSLPLTNITPNGGVAPKIESCIWYNQFLKAWCDLVEELTTPSPELLSRFRLTPNLRVKFGSEDKRNIGRKLNTAIPHSDAWVEGPWGLNCHIPIAGDLVNNFLQFYKLIDESTFTDKLLELNDSYTEMQWATEYFEVDRDVIAEAGYVYLSDYAMMHKTFIKPRAGTRLSLDSTLMVGSYPVWKDREGEYTASIPRIGETVFVKCLLSEADDIVEKKSVFSHYSIQNLQNVRI